MIDMSLFEPHNWKQFYEDIKELLPDNVPRAIGKALYGPLWMQILLVIV